MPNMKWDHDIASSKLTKAEKDGLQVYRNYGKSFDAARQKQFTAGVDYAPFDVKPLEEVMALVAREDVRFVPVIACAFVDEILAEMFRRFLPDDIPGGKKSMTGRFGPISSLFARIQFAWAFDMVHSDLLTGLDKLREHRNKISHTWKQSTLRDYFETPLPMMDELEASVLHRLRRQGEQNSFTPEQSLRVRTIWLLARLFYETRFYPLAKMAQIKPFKALYGEHHPRALAAISDPAYRFTDAIAADI